VRWWFAADEPDALHALLDEQTAAAATGPDDRPVSNVDRVIGAGRARLGIVDPDARKIRLAHRLVTKGEPWRGGRSDIWFTPAGLAGRGAGAAAGGSGRAPAPVAFLFPGVEPAAGADVIDLAGLGGILGIDAPAVRYDTVSHQGASIFQLGLFLHAALGALGIEPDVAAGHSVGEWAGAVATGMLPEENAGDFLGALDLHGLVLPELDFAAITGPAAAVGGIVADIEGVVISHENCPGQTVLCGPPAAIDRALARLHDARVLGQKLPFQSGFHTPAIAPALGTLRQMIGGLPLGPGTIPLWSATLAAPWPDDPEEIRELHLRHLVEPVRFRELVERLYHDAGARIFIQVGMGSLASFVDDTLRDVDHAAVEVLSAKRSALAQMHRALTALWVEGLEARPERLHVAGAAAATGARAANGDARTGPVRVAARSNGAATVPAPAHPSPSRAVAPADPPAVAPVPYPLLAATNLLTQAATASRQVLHALAARYALPPVDAHTTTSQYLETALGAAPTDPGAAVAPPGVGQAAPAAAPPVQPSRPGKPWPTGTTVVTRHLSLETRPETLDHSLNQLPEGWPDPSDGFPLMAMTTQIDLLQKVAEEYGGGRDIVEVFGVRNLRWLDLSDPTDVDIRIVPKGEDVLSLALGGFCRLNVRFGRFPPAPRHEEQPIAYARPTMFDARELFERKLMFHGPAFQGIDHMGPISDDRILGTFTHLATPGSLLDNLGKLVAYWVIDDRAAIGEGALPTGLGRVEFFGPEPEPGTTIHCDVRIRRAKISQVQADGVLVLPDGRLWCRLEEWTSLVFHLDELMEGIYHEPAHKVAAEPQPGGWTIVRERWPSGAARDMTAHQFLTRAERAIYFSKNLLEQRRWLLDTIAAKESVRLWLRDIEHIPSYPVEVTVEPDGPDRYRAVSDRIPAHLDLRITVSRLNWATAAIVSHAEPHLDIEARVVPTDSEGDADPDEAERIARDAAAALAARNPGAEVAWVPMPDYVVPSVVAETIGIAVAWTVRDPSGEAVEP
jgi:malonyl CoA-acyl carrier protein transacylase